MTLRTVFGQVAVLVAGASAWPGCQKTPASGSAKENAASASRQQLHARLRTPGFHHDHFIKLTEIGNKDSVPLLIRNLRWMERAEAKRQKKPFKELDVVNCSLGHAVSALRALTGQDRGMSSAAWQRWWDKSGKALPRSHFKPRRIKRRRS